MAKATAKRAQTLSRTSAAASLRPPGKRSSEATRKRIEFDAETWQALHALSVDSVRSLQELADEAFGDLLKKHGRPVTLSEALNASARAVRENDTRREATADKVPPRHQRDQGKEKARINR